MSTYDLGRADLTSNLVSSVGGGLTDRILEALTAQPGGQGQEISLLSQYTPGTVVPTGTGLVLVDPNFSGNFGTLPNAPAVIFSGPAGVQVVLDGGTEQIVQMGSGVDVVTLATSARQKFVDLGGGDDNFIGNEQSSSVIAGSGNNRLDMQGGDDAVDISGGASTVDGGTGFDLAYVGGKKSDFNVITENGVTTIVDRATGAASQIQDVEYIKFGDGSVVINLATQELAAIARVYEVALNRAADNTGLKFWTSQKELAAGSVIDFASAFLGSVEFTDKFGAVDTLTNQQFLEVIYKSAFERDADAGGLKFWLDQMSTGMTRGEVVVRFAFEVEAQQTFDGSVNVINTIV